MLRVACLTRSLGKKELTTMTAKTAVGGGSAKTLSPIRLFAVAKRVKKPRGAPAFAGYSLAESVKLLRCFGAAQFDETIEIALATGLDPRKPNQLLRGVTSLPHGTGQNVRVAVFARGAKAEEAKAAGADVVGAEDLAEKMEGGDLDFTRCIATPDMMAVVGRLGRVLGPRGLMPNPKVGTVTADVAAAVTSAKQGQIEYRSEKQGIVHAAVGKLSFGDEKLAENITSLVAHLLKVKPSGAKMSYLSHAHLSSTMGPGIKLSVEEFKPKK